MARVQRLCWGIGSLLMAAAIWLPAVHRFYPQSLASFHSAKGLPLKGRYLAARHLALWTDPKLKKRELDRMRRSNAEWDFMGRSFLVWSLAEMGMREPASKPLYLPVIDEIIAETIRLEHDQGIYFFLMPYAKARPYLAQPARSHFLDSEIALMLAMRRMLEEKPEYRPLLAERVNLMVERMRRSPVLGAESYPDECWMFDHAVGLAAIKLGDHLDGNDHTALFRQWLAIARSKLVHTKTGLLISSFTTDGTHLDGPEGSSIWMVAHCLRLLDEEFARDQYHRARRELGRDLLGFGFSREWPVSWEGPLDIDSGAVIPLLGASAGGSGLALVGASSFQDLEYLSRLQASLDFAAFPVNKQKQLKYCASNQVGDAVMLYATVLGPIWQRAAAGGNR